MVRRNLKVQVWDKALKSVLFARITIQTEEHHLLQP